MKPDQREALLGLYVVLHYAICRSKATPNDPGFVKAFGVWLSDPDLIGRIREARGALLATGFDVPDSWLTAAVVKLSVADLDLLEKVTREISAAKLRLESQPAKEAPIPAKARKTGMPVETVRKLGEDFLKHNDYPGNNALAKIIGCSQSTMSEATELSSKLRIARAKKEARRGRGNRGSTLAPATTAQSRETEPSQHVSEEELLERLKAKASPAERDKLDSMSGAKIRDLLNTIGDDPESLKALDTGRRSRTFATPKKP